MAIGCWSSVNRSGWKLSDAGPHEPPNDLVGLATRLTNGFIEQRLEMMHFPLSSRTDNREPWSYILSLRQQLLIA
jgi:hypothetical protein